MATAAAPYSNTTTAPYSNTTTAGEAAQMAQTVNQANNAYNTVSAAIPQGTKDFMQTAKDTIFDNDKLRSFSAFFGIGEEGNFTFTADPATLCTRLKTNVLFFYLNYILMAAVILVITLFATIITPTKLITAALLICAWVIVLKATSSGEFSAFDGKLSISRKVATTITMVVTGIVLFFLVKGVLYITFGSSLFLAFFHATLRDATRYYEEGGGENGGVPSDGNDGFVNVAKTEEVI